MSVQGIITAMVTPFDRHGRVAEEETVALMRYLVAHGSDGLVVAGTTGEASTLTDEEKCRLWELAVGECADVPVIASTGSNDTRHTVDLTERATALGVDAVLIVTPYYNKPNRRGIVAHFRAAAAATDKPVIVYNIPARCVVDIPNDLLRDLAEIPNICAVKQARADGLEAIDGLDLLAGNDDMLAAVLDAGGSGGILVASHIAAPQMRRMIDEPHARAEINESLAGLFAALSITTNPIPIKAALELLGHHVGGLRLPLVEASDDELARIREAVELYRPLIAGGTR